MRDVFHLALSLASVVLVLLPVDAAPPGRNNGIITLPIRSTHVHERKGLHSQISREQHINRVERRLAHITGRTYTSDDLVARLQKRMDTVDPRDVTEADPPTAPNSIGLDIEGPDAGYIAQIQIGTPPRNFELVVDSGSADLWVGAEGCTSDGGECGDHEFLGAQSSSSFHDTGKYWELAYVTGNVSGTIVRDNVVVAGLELQNHIFGTAQIESKDFSGNGLIDGVVGTGGPALSRQHNPTLVEGLVSQGHIKEAIISYKISRLSDQKNDGEITFGGLDTTKFEHDTLVTLPNVDPKGSWVVPIDAVTVNGQDVNLPARNGIFDTGTTIVWAPPADASAVHKLIDGAQPFADEPTFFTIPCNTTQSVALVFGGKSFEINTRDLTERDDSSGVCFSAIASRLGAGEWLLGDTFFKNVYFSTDLQKNSVSIAKPV